MEYIAIITLLAVIGFLGWFIKSMRDDFQKERTELLNRVMATNYAQYVQAEVVRSQAERPMTAEEIYEMQQERGIPA